MTNGIGIAGQVEDAHQRFSTPFNAKKEAEQNVQLSIDPSFGLNRRRYQWYSNGTIFDSTNVSDVEAGIRLSTTPTGTDSVRLHSQFPGQYVSQSLAQPGIACVVDESDVDIAEDGSVSLTHGELYVGAFWWDDANDQVDTGVGYKWDSTGWYFFLKSRGQHLGDSPVPQGEFSIDSMSGNGPSGRGVDPSNGYVYNFPYTWYNEGPFNSAMLIAQLDSVEDQHRESVGGRPTTETPNFPIQSVVRNDGTAQSLGVEIGGMQYSTYGAGLDDIEYRETDEAVITGTSGYISPAVSVTADGSTNPQGEPGVPLISFRRKADSRSLTLAIQELNVSAVSDDIYVFQWDEWDDQNALTGYNFTEPTSIAESSESNIQTDVSSTDYTPSSNSILRSIQFFEGGTKNKEKNFSDSEVDASVPIGATRVITAVNAGNASADVDPFLIKIEEAY